MIFTKRQLVEVRHEVNNSLSWMLFKEFLEAQSLENENTADSYSSDLTKLLLREQHYGAGKALDKLLENFQSHVANEINNKKDNENDQIQNVNE